MIVAEPDPRLNNHGGPGIWLSRLTVWSQNLFATPLALITAGLTVWLNLAVPLADPKLLS